LGWTHCITVQFRFKSDDRADSNVKALHTEAEKWLHTGAVATAKAQNKGLQVTVTAHPMQSCVCITLQWTQQTHNFQALSEDLVAPLLVFYQNLLNASDTAPHEDTAQNLAAAPKPDAAVGGTAPPEDDDV
jgi:hypothetical protein